MNALKFCKLFFFVLFFVVYTSCCLSQTKQAESELPSPSKVEIPKPIHPDGSHTLPEWGQKLNVKTDEKAFFDSLIISSHLLVESFGKEDFLFTIIEKYPDLINKRMTDALRGKTDLRDSYTLLQKAVLHRRLEIVYFLINKKADLNAKSFDGLQAIHIAAQTDNVEIFKLLLEKGADINAKTVELPERVLPGTPIGPNPIPGVVPKEPSKTVLEIAKEYKSNQIVDFINNFKPLKK